MDPIARTLLAYGPLGVFALLSIIFMRAMFDRLTTERDNERAYSMELEKDLRERIVPLITSVQATTSEAVKVIGEIRTEQQFEMLRKQRGL
ncbi:MAG TPA: hypothetical protein VJ742_12375 [Nitrososphaera sp.]|nr:hypothetical protein [Nitrososphaera sp.]